MLPVVQDCCLSRMAGHHVSVMPPLWVLWGLLEGRCCCNCQLWTPHLGGEALQLISVGLYLLVLQCAVGCVCAVTIVA
jgi:hypothetical protein